MPSTPPPSYSAALQNDKRKPQVEFPYSHEISVFWTAGISLFLGGLMFIFLFSLLIFRTCSPTERLEPCEFDGKLSFDKIFSMKKQINETQKKIDEITNVMNYGLSIESSTTLLKKQNSFNETLEKLLEKFNFQKKKFEKCYFENFEFNKNSRTLFLRISTVFLSLIIFFCFLTSCFYLRKVPLSQLNEEETESYKKMCILIVCCFIFTLGILCMIVTCVFVNNFEEFDEIEDIPIFVAETWYFKCSGRQQTIRTAEEFVSQRSYNKNFH